MVVSVIGVESLMDVLQRFFALLIEVGLCGNLLALTRGFCIEETVEVGRWNALGAPRIRQQVSPSGALEAPGARLADAL